MPWPPVPASESARGTPRTLRRSANVIAQRQAESQPRQAACAGMRLRQRDFAGMGEAPDVKTVAGRSAHGAASCVSSTATTCGSSLPRILPAFPRRAGMVSTPRALRCETMGQCLPAVSGLAGVSRIKAWSVDPWTQLGGACVFYPRSCRSAASFRRQGGVVSHQDLQTAAAGQDRRYAARERVTGRTWPR
jgi:hypothetical protein